MAIDTATQRTVTPEELAVMYPPYSARYWRTLLQKGKIPGASKPFGRWFIPIKSIRTLIEGGNRERDEV